MWNLRPRDTRDRRFKKKRRATFFALTFGVVAQLLNQLNMLSVCCDQSYGMKDRFSLVTLVFLTRRRSREILIIFVQRCMASMANVIVHWSRCNTDLFRPSVIFQGPFFLD